VLAASPPGSIVVMHLHGRANAPATGQALRLLIPELEKRGYHFLTVTELLAAGTPIEPVGTHQISEFYQPPPLPQSQSRRAPTLRWCGWVIGPHGRVWVCR
jgi:hypothetical protein